MVTRAFILLNSELSCVQNYFPLKLLIKHFFSKTSFCNHPDDEYQGTKPGSEPRTELRATLVATTQTYNGLVHRNPNAASVEPHYFSPVAIIAAQPTTTTIVCTLG
jgi:hypothetical protein